MLPVRAFEANKHILAVFSKSRVINNGLHHLICSIYYLNRPFSTLNMKLIANRLTGLGVEKLLILNAVKSKEPESSIDLGKGEYLSCDIIMNRQNIDDLIKHPFFVKNYLESESLYNTLNNVFYFEGMT